MNFINDMLFGEPKIDYEEGTDLFDSIESRNWLECVRLAKSCKREVRTWIYKRNEQSELVWIVLPLHAALVAGAPISVIKALTESYHDSVMKKDDQGNFPIHLAANRFEPNDEVLSYLLKLFPEGIQHKSNTGMGMVPYERIPELHQLLLDRDWQGAIMRVEFHPEEAMLWVIRTDESGNIKVRFSALHLAIDIGAPENVLDVLLEAFPQSVKCVDEEGMIALQRELLKEEQDKLVIQKLLKQMMYKEGKKYKVVMDCC